MIQADKVIIQSYVEKNEGNIINTINDSSIDSTEITNDVLNVDYVPELKKALDHLQEECTTAEANEYIEDIRHELRSEKPNAGRIRAIFNMLKRVCSNDNFLKAAKVFGELLIIALK